MNARNFESIAAGFDQLRESFQAMQSALDGGCSQNGFIGGNIQLIRLVASVRGALDN